MSNFCYGRFLRTGLLHICQGGLDLVDPALGKKTRLNNLLSFLAHLLGFNDTPCCTNTSKLGRINK